MNSVKKVYFIIALVIVLVFPSVHVEASTLAYNSLQSTSKPGDLWSLGDGDYYFHGAADNQTLYTNYCFSDASIVEITTKNTSSTYNLNFAVYSKEPWYSSDICVGTNILIPGATSIRIVNLNPNKNYYIVFSAPCKF